MREQETDSLAASLLGTSELKKGKNLLAFSAGSDSTALFFLLQELAIPFDLAIVNYHLRPQSDAEVAYAKELAQRFGKKLYIKDAPLQGSNIEARAHSIRYNFFEQLIQEHGYTNLITAHHLNDLTEWFLMQFTKGAGVVELVGMEPIQQKEGYTLIRPLLLTQKKSIEAFLEQKKIHYFHDESNDDLTITRNLFRHTIVNQLLERYAEGIAKSFEYLLEDKKLLQPPIFSIQKLHLAPTGKNSYETKRILSYLFKPLGYLLTAAQKEEMVRQKRGVIGGRFAFAIEDDLIWAAPYVKRKIPKKVREEFRKASIPAPLRGYLYQAGIDMETIASYKERLQKLQ